MADIADNGSATAELFLNQALQNQKDAAEAAGKIQPVGYCLNPLCSNDFSPEETRRLFCNSQCADQHSIYGKG